MKESMRENMEFYVFAIPFAVLCVCVSALIVWILK